MKYFVIVWLVIYPIGVLAKEAHPLVIVGSILVGPILLFGIFGWIIYKFFFRGKNK